MTDIATNCTNDIAERVKTVNEFGSVGKEKIFSVYSEDDLMDKSKMLSFPCVGIMYEGIQSNNLDKTGQGMAADLKVALVLLMDSKQLGNLNTKNEAARILDLMRKAIRLRRSPSVHKWSFVSEMPVGEVEGANIYIQRWSTPVILTSS